MRNQKILFFLFLSTALFTLSAETSQDVKTTIERTEIRYQEFARNAENLVRKANELLADRRYFEARDLYIKAKQTLEPHKTAPLFARQIEFCDRQIAECYFSKAQEAMQKADELVQQREYEDAIALCREALKYCPEQAAVLEERIAYMEKRRDLAAAHEAASEATLLPNQDNQDYQIEILMEQGRRLVAAKEYVRALRKFQEVLLINPYHGDAMQNVEMLNHRIGKIGTARYTDSRRQMLAETEWKFAIPFRPDANSSAAENLLEEGKPVVKAIEENEELNRKLENIVIPEVKFDDATIVEVVKLLSELSQRFDPDKRGINFLLRRAVKTVSAADAAPEENSSGAGNDVYQSTSDSDNKLSTGDELLDRTVTMDIKNKTLLQALTQLCKQADLRYRVEKYAVIIAPRNVALDELEAKLFAVDIPPSEQDKDKLKALCEASGVTFPDGAKLFYDPKINRLVAINTADNLRMIEEKILPQYDEKMPMIQIMIKFIEITQNDLDELAFNWQFSMNSNNKMINDDGTASSTWSTRGESNQLLRYYVPEDTPSDVQTNDAFRDANLQFIWQNQDGTKITAQMFALNWADSSDVLYSPRVTTLDKTTAHIGMYTERYFPSDWESPDVESSDIRGSGEERRLVDIDPQPTLDNLQKLGLSFDITPEIRDLENGLISVPVEFPLRTHVGWKVYDARSYSSDNSVDGEYYKMPIFEDRNVKTDVMIRDGETVILAGIATDITQIIHDKIPLLGDLPIVGRLFQSRSTKSEKGNLLIFLTCRLVKADGSAYNPAAAGHRNGQPTFGRIQ